MANVKFVTVAEFKTAINSSSLSVVKNPKTDKLFVADNTNGKSYKCQADLDKTKPVVFLIEDGDLDGACLINGNNNTIMEL